MAIRSGMQNLVDRVRKLTGAGTAEYTVGTVTYWTDTHIQDILDSNARFLIECPLQWLPQNVGGTTEYLIAQFPYRDLEEAESGSARWQIQDGAGAVQGTADYSTDYRAGRVTWSSDQGGTQYYLTAYTYDVHAAAADLWLERIAEFNNWYQFSSSNESFSRQQAWDHAVKAEQLMRGKAGQNVVSNAGGDVRTGVFARTDLN